MDGCGSCCGRFRDSVERSSLKEPYEPVGEGCAYSLYGDAACGGSGPRG